MDPTYPKGTQRPSIIAVDRAIAFRLFERIRTKPSKMASWSRSRSRIVCSEEQWKLEMRDDHVGESRRFARIHDHHMDDTLECNSSRMSKNSRRVAYKRNTLAVWSSWSSGRLRSKRYAPLRRRLLLRGTLALLTFLILTVAHGNRYARFAYVPEMKKRYLRCATHTASGHEYRAR